MQKKAQSNKKQNKQSIDDNPEPVVSTRDGEISVFSQEFIEHNKKRQGYLQRIRREIADIDEEESLIRKNIERLQSKYGDLHVSNRADDHSSKMNEKILSRWRGLVINALESAKLLDSLHLNKESSVDDVIKSLEEASKKPNDQIKNCLNAINFG